MSEFTLSARQQIPLYRFLALALLLSLSLFMLCRLEFYFINASLFSAITIDRWVEITLGGLRFDLSAVLYTNALFILLLITPHPFRSRPKFKTIVAIIFFITNGFAILMNIGDSFYYPFTLRRTTRAIFDQFAHEPNMRGLMFHYVLEYWYGVLLWFGFCLGMVTLYNRIPAITYEKGIGKVSYLVAFGGMLIVVTLTIGGMRGGFSGDPPLAPINAAAYARGPADLSLILNTPFTFLTASTPSFTRRDFYSNDSLKLIFDPVKRREQLENFKSTNVVIIMLESFSQSYTGNCIPSKEGAPQVSYTPFLDSLSRHSKTYRFGKANGIRSVDAVPSVICSLPPIDDPYFISAYAGNRVNSLASLLKQKGYSTSFFHGGNNGTMSFDAFARLAGFEEYYGRNEYNNDNDYDGIWGIWDEPFLQFFAERLSTMKEPFFTTMFTLSSHDPYKVPDQYKQKFPEGTLRMHQVVAYSDYSLKKFFEKVSTMPWYNHTLFVLTADHAYAWNDFSIPIIFYKPDENWAECIDEIAQQTDIMPTVLGYLNYDQPYVSFGRDLFRHDMEPFAFHYIDNTYRMFFRDYLLMFKDPKYFGLFDLKKDLGLKYNLASSRADVAKIAEPKLKAFIQQYSNRMIGDSLTIARP